MKILAVLAAAIWMLALAGCGRSYSMEDYDQIELDMTKERAIELIGSASALTPRQSASAGQFRAKMQKRKPNDFGFRQAVDICGQTGLGLAISHHLLHHGKDSLSRRTPVRLLREPLPFFASDRFLPTGD